MSIRPSVRVFWSLLLATLLTNVPYMAWADAAAPRMISTAAVVEDLSRGEAQAKVQTFLSRAEVRSELVRQGVSPDEISQRLASLSNQELNQLAHQMDQAQYGGDVVGILVVVLLVILIIYLAKRI